MKFQENEYLLPKEILDKVRSILDRHIVGWSDRRFLFAVSGGMDSMFMLYSGHLLELDMEVAHVNFSLRGDNSDMDESFVTHHAQSLGLQVHTTKIDIAKYGEDKHLTIQEAAREFRYQWFEEIRSSKNIDFICTAHHKNDEIENFFIQLIRGTGIMGLSGIPVLRDHIFRPILELTRDEIENSTRLHHIPFREDDSNKELKYTRNKIRHVLLPAIEKIKPEFQNVMIRNLDRLKSESDFLEGSINHFVRLSEDGRFSTLEWPVSGFSSSAGIGLLFTWLKHYGFNWKTCSQIADSDTGSLFIKNENRVTRDRDRIILSILPSREIEQEFFTLKQAISFGAGTIDIDILTTRPVQFSENQFCEYLDADSINGRLMLRNYREGDRFQPFGMNGQQKKISDLLTDLKLNYFEKEEVLILEDEVKILWVVGYRLDHRCRLVDDTQRFMKVCLTFH